MEILRSLGLTLILCRCTAIDIEDIYISNCTNGLNCDDVMNPDSITIRVTEKINVLNEEVDTNNIGQVAVENTINTNAAMSTQHSADNESPTTRISIGGSTLGTIEPATQPAINFDDKIHPAVCSCDLTVATCDMDCCCDTDCNGYELSGLPHYRYHQLQMYDSHYCHTMNDIHRNSTRFTFGKLARNLFCIAYDNLPPIDRKIKSLDLGDQISPEDARTVLNPRKYLWDWNKFDIPPEINTSMHDYHSDRILKFQNDKITFIELPQSGFTSECKFKKILKYQETSKWKCMQTNLSNNNEYLFSRAYDNFTVVSPSYFLNLTYLMTQNHTCPDSICVPVLTFYCLDFRNNCNTTKLPEQSCVNGVCRNVIKRVHYKIVLGGKCDLPSIEVRYDITNTSESFYQYFEVTFEKRYKSLGKSFAPIGNSGYAIGNRIITGNPEQPDMNNVSTKYTNVTNSISYLTLPISQSNGECNSHGRYSVRFGEDIRLKCSVELKIDQSLSDSCTVLQNRLFDLYFDYLSHTTSGIVTINTNVSKTGEISKTGTSNWTQILFDNIPRNVITRITDDNRVHCSGLLTSMNINILYAIQPILDDIDHYKVEGISVQVNKPFDISWLKCVEPKCDDVLRIELLSLVSFTDISTKSMYSFVSGPNLDISLPYDFFYPFMNNSNNAKPTFLIIQLVTAIVIFYFFEPLWH